MDPRVRVSEGSSDEFDASESLRRWSISKLNCNFEIGWRRSATKIWDVLYSLGVSENFLKQRHKYSSKAVRYKQEDGPLQTGRRSASNRKTVSYKCNQPLSQLDVPAQQPPAASIRHESEYVDLNCPVCRFSYAITNITNHIRKAHAGAQVTQQDAAACGLVACSCGQVVLNAAALKRHQGIRHCHVLPLPTPSATQPDPAPAAVPQAEAPPTPDASPLIAQASRDTSLVRDATPFLPADNDTFSHSPHLSRLNKQHRGTWPASYRRPKRGAVHLVSQSYQTSVEINDQLMDASTQIGFL